MPTKEVKKQITRYVQSEFSYIFGDSYSAYMFKQYIEGEFNFAIHFTPAMLCVLMDHYVVSKDDMAKYMGVSVDCLNSLLKLRHDLPKLFDIRIGYAAIILILGTQKYGKRKFAKWYNYYLNKHNVETHIKSFIYIEIIKLLSSNSQVSISYYWDELLPKPKVRLYEKENNKAL